MLVAAFLDYWYPFLLVFARVAAFFSLLPFLSPRGIPFMLRVFLALVVAALLVAPLGPADLPPRGDAAFLLSLGRELLVGLALTFVVYALFSLFVMAGQMIDLKAGLMMSGLFDPQFGSQVTITGQLYYQLALVIFLTMNGHHLLLSGLAQSFELIPLQGPFMNPSLVSEYARIFGKAFVLAFQLAAPVAAVLILTDLALGFLARVVPQIHVFILGLPLKIALALLVLVFLLPLMGGVLESVFHQLSRDFYLIMRSWS